MNTLHEHKETNGNEREHSETDSDRTGQSPDFSSTGFHESHVMKIAGDPALVDFKERREFALNHLLSRNGIRNNNYKDHNKWFCEAYDSANGDIAAVPWADLRPRTEIVKWLSENPGSSMRAVEVGCGLGDNAEAIAGHGWDVTAFDISETAINWAKSRFPDSDVEYRAADLLNPPKNWLGAFNLVVECQNLQSFHPGALRKKAMASVFNLLAPGGVLLIATRFGKEHELENGPPWPLTMGDIDELTGMGLQMGLIRPSMALHKGNMVAEITCELKKHAKQ